MDNNKKIITIFDQALLEIDLIDAIFKAQFSNYDPTNNRPYPTILGADGYSGINGRYIATMEFFSDIEWLNIYQLDEEIKSRYIHPSFFNFVNSYLTEIRENAITAVNYYNENLTSEKTIASEYLNKCKNLSFSDEWGFKEHHEAIITISDNCLIYEIYLGLNMITKIHNHVYKYRQVFTTNYELAGRLQKIINYIDRFGLTDDEPNTPPIPPDGQLPNYCISEGRIVDIYNLLISKRIIENIDTADFMKCFNLGTPPKKTPGCNHDFTLVYILSLIKKPGRGICAINDQIAERNFGIKGFRQKKSQVLNMYPVEEKLKFSIDKLLKTG